MSEDPYNRDEAGRFGSGNPGGPGGVTGRKKFSLKAALERAIEETHNEATGRTILDALAMSALKAAQEGDFRFWKEILDRFDGPIRQQIEQDQTIFIERISNMKKLAEEDSDGAS